MLKTPGGGPRRRLSPGPPETSYTRDFLELWIFARIGSHDANTSRAITSRELHGSAWNFAWCKIIRLSNEVSSITDSDRTSSRYTSSKLARPHIHTSQSPAEQPSPVFLFEFKLYGACSTSHYNHQSCNPVCQHTTFNENTVFWVPETSYNIHVLNSYFWQESGLMLRTLPAP